jgi:hypothetical protein
MSKVWILPGVTGSEPALLSQEAGQVTLSTFSDNDEPVPSFSVQTAEISDVKFPAYQFSGGCSFVAAGLKYRISLIMLLRDTYFRWPRSLPRKTLVSAEKDAERRAP